MSTPLWNIAELAAWSGQTEQLRLRRGDLLFPHPRIWPRAGDSFPELAQAILSSLDAPTRPLFLQCCMASWLLDPQAAPSCFPEWLAGRDTDGLGLPLPLDEVLHWQWRQALVLLFSAGQGRVLHVLYGVGNSGAGLRFPRWAVDRMDAEARQAVHSAWDAAEMGARAGCFWPILAFTEPGGHLHGASLGLPAWLAFRTMDARKPTLAMAATGCIDARGRVLPVHGLEQKYQAARQARLATFVYPDQEGVRIGEMEPTEPVAVGCLEEAEAVWLHGVPGIANETALLVRSHNQGEFVRRLCRVPGSLLGWLESRNRTVSTALRSTSLTGDDLRALLQQMDELIKITPMPRDRLSPVMDALDEETVDVFMGKWPDLAYRVCNHQLRWASSFGDSAQAACWEAKARACGDKAIQYGEYSDELFLEDVLRLVGRLHNQYVFRPDPPEDFSRKLRALEERFARLREIHPAAALKILGKYHGVMIQNLAFCGPKLLPEVRAFARKARAAFGNAPRERDELLRLENYLVYASLDAGLFADAEGHLREYLGLESLDQGLAWEHVTDPFQHAAVARYMADTGRALPGYPEWIRSSWQHTAPVHPWQLWLHNAGRFTRSDDPALAAALFRRSLDICQSFGGPTVRAMALLPLGALHDLLPDAELQELRPATEAVLTAIRDSDLDRDHFTPILSAPDWQNALHVVLGQAQRLFPFTYR